MAITFTAGLTPTFPDDSFGSEKEHVRLLSTELIGNTAFANPLATVLAALVTQIDATNTLLDADMAVANSHLLYKDLLVVYQLVGLLHHILQMICQLLKLVLTSMLSGQLHPRPTIQYLKTS